MDGPRALCSLCGCNARALSVSLSLSLTLASLSINRGRRASTIIIIISSIGGVLIIENFSIHSQILERHLVVGKRIKPEELNNLDSLHTLHATLRLVDPTYQHQLTGK